MASYVYESQNTGINIGQGSRHLHVLKLPQGWGAKSVVSPSKHVKPCNHCDKMKWVYGEVYYTNLVEPWGAQKICSDCICSWLKNNNDLVINQDHTYNDNLQYEEDSVDRILRGERCGILPRHNENLGLGGHYNDNYNNNLNNSSENNSDDDSGEDSDDMNDFIVEDEDVDDSDQSDENSDSEEEYVENNEDSDQNQTENYESEGGSDKNSDEDFSDGNQDYDSSTDGAYNYSLRQSTARNLQKQTRNQVGKNKKRSRKNSSRTRVKRQMIQRQSSISNNEQDSDNNSILNEEQNQEQIGQGIEVKQEQSEGVDSIPQVQVKQEFNEDQTQTQVEEISQIAQDNEPQLRPVYVKLDDGRYGQVQGMYVKFKDTTSVKYASNSQQPIDQQNTHSDIDVQVKQEFDDYDIGDLDQPWVRIDNVKQEQEVDEDMSGTNVQKRIKQEEEY
eukprot:TRINITY_DN29311_c0_g1_i5.p1 TRINITY_DN29311_c0_g1~~TRINITY_DN29311_c0_g1_i5.p1  ORF type:complete len:481 (+),score=55.95 TRINITY_DN29311_c0_g1_i5:106-1443(+)